MGKNLKIRKNLLRIFFSSALLFAISALQAQVCTNWTVKIDSIDNTCWANGQIKVTAHGPDVDDGALNNYRYTLYQNGEPFNGSEMTIAADPLTPHIQTFLGLPDGTYDIKVQAFCVRENTDTGTEPGRNESWFKATVKGTGWTKPTIDANATAGYQAMPCFPLGQITLKSIVAKTFPVKVKMVLAPNEYDINERYKDSIIYFSNTTNPSTITIDSLPAGDYRFMVYDGCNWDEPSSLVTVGTYGKNFPDQFFSTNNYFSYQGIYPVESSYFSPIKTGMGCNVIKVRKLFSSDLYNLQSKLLPLMEYTLLYPSETPNASSVWKSFDMTTTGDILELRHTLKEVHEATNKLTVLPKMAVRYKDGGCYGEYKVYNLPSFSTPPSLRSFDGNYGSVFYNVTRLNCDAFKLNFQYKHNRPAYQEDARWVVVCYPITITVRNQSDGNIVKTQNFPYMNSDAEFYISDIPNGKYYVDVKDASGLMIHKNMSVISEIPPVEAQIDISREVKNHRDNMCQDSVAYVLSSSNANMSLAGATVKFLGYNLGSSANVVPPPCTEFTIPDDHPASRKYYLYAKDPLTMPKDSGVFLQPEKIPYGSNAVWLITTKCKQQTSLPKLSVNLVPQLTSGYRYLNSNTGRVDVCADSIAPYISVSSSSYVEPLYMNIAGATVEFVSATGGAKEPPVKKFFVPNTVWYGDHYTNSYYRNQIFLYSNNPAPDYNDYNSNNQWTSGTIPRHDFPYGSSATWRITSRCGGQTPVLLKYTAPQWPRSFPDKIEDVLDITKNCGEIIIKMKNNGAVGVYQDPQTQEIKAGSWSPYLFVTEKPADANIYYSNGSSSNIGSGGHAIGTSYIRINKGGTFKLALGTNNSSNSSYCHKIYTIKVDNPSLEPDASVTTAYQCPDGTGANVYIRVKNANDPNQVQYSLYTTIGKDTTYVDSNNTGSFTQLPPVPVGNSFMVEVTDLVCGSKFRTPIYVLDLKNAQMSGVEGGNIKCEGDSITIWARALGESTYKWTFTNGIDTENWNDRQIKIPVASFSNSGQYVVQVAIDGCDNQVMRDTLQLTVAPKLMYWKKNAASNNWNDPKNWLGEGGAQGKQMTSVPSPCTTVHIPGNAKLYPNLSQEFSPRDVYGKPVCGDIYYHYGAETAFPHVLRYNKSFVQYSFGHYNGVFQNGVQPTTVASTDKTPSYPGFDVIKQPLMKRMRWYNIASPLKGMLSGDFSLGGYPFTYQQNFNAQDPALGRPAYEDFTAPFNSYVEKLSDKSQAMAVFVAGYDDRFVGMKDHKNLEALQGVIQIPYFDNPDIMQHRTLQSFNSEDSTMTYKYFHYETLEPMDPLEKPADVVSRSFKNHRFVFEKDDNLSEYAMVGDKLQPICRMTVNAPALKRVMIGNPFMCHLDFDKLFKYNHKKIFNSYRIYNGETKAFDEYNAGVSAAGLTSSIAPLQAIIVEFKTAGNVELVLPMEGDSATIANVGTLLPKPRVAAVDKNKGYLTLAAITQPTTVGGDSIRTSSMMMLNYPDAKQTTKAIYPEGLKSKAEVFFIDSDGYFNATQTYAEERPPIVKLGIQSQCKSPIRLKLDKFGLMEDVDVKLVDKLAGITTSIGNSSYYTFQHDGTKLQNSIEGLSIDRFELHFVYPQSGIDDTDDTYVYSGVKDQTLNVTTNGLIEDINVINMVGISILDERGLNVDSYHTLLNVPAGSYIVKVRLSNGLEKTTKVIVL